MKATIIFPGKWLLSKQNSYCAGRFGRKYKNPRYAAEQLRMIECMRPQLKAQNWKCTNEYVKIEIIFYGPTPPCDFENCGLLVDSFQGSSRVIGGKRIRSEGQVVLDDKQFWPASLYWIKSDERKIVVNLETGDK